MPFFPTRARGQNFLHDRSVARRFAAAALGTSEGSEHGAIVEIGPGTGAITFPLIEAGAFVLGVELDPRLAARLEGRARDRGVHHRLRVVAADARDFDFAAGIRESGVAFPLPACGNLPFSTASRLLVRLVGSTTPGPVQLFDSLTLTLQREVAQRVAAPSGHPDYGPLSVVVQQAVLPRLLFLIHPAAFRPRPRVVAAVLRLVPRPDPPRPGDPVRFHRLVRGLFRHRRKTLKNCIAALGDRALREGAARAAAALGLDPGFRPGQLTVSEFAALSRLAGGEGLGDPPAC